MQARLVKTFLGDLSDTRVLDVWKDHWESCGWATRILTHWDARRHPRYREGMTDGVLQWLAFAQTGGGLMVKNDVLVREDFSTPVIGNHIVVSLAGSGATIAVVASSAGAINLAWSALGAGAILPDDRAELCVEAGSRDWDSAPLVYFSDHACKVHKREKLQWMREFAEKALEIEKIC